MMKTCDKHGHSAGAEAVLVYEPEVGKLRTECPVCVEYDEGVEYRAKLETKIEKLEAEITELTASLLKVQNLRVDERKELKKLKSGEPEETRGSWT